MSEVKENNTNFPSNLYDKLKSLFVERTDLFEYQQYIYNYLINYDVRGILLYHTVGTGKTITSISIAENFRKLGKKIYILSSKSLHENYKKELLKYDENIDLTYYRFVTFNAKNMIKSLGDELSFMIDTSLEDKLIIVDEAHNLFNSIANGSKIANEFYDIVMKTKNIKIIFLSGTPIINDPFELFPAFNMIAGKEILPETYDDYLNYFIDRKGNKIKNVDKFKNRIFGMTSYYGDFYHRKIDDVTDEMKMTIKKENYPDRLPIIVEVLNMSKIQLTNYKTARDKEKQQASYASDAMKGLGEKRMNANSECEINNEEIKEGRNETKEGTTVTGGISKDRNMNSGASYRMQSREYSNIYFPNPSIKLTKDNFKHYSPKMVKIYENIVSNPTKRISLVYSVFLKYGVEAFANLLELNGYTKYAIFSGQQTVEEKNEILKKVNSDENKYGDIISILLISKSGAEGLDLKNVRDVHIMEPYWNYSLIEQIIARAVRYKSHILLKDEEKNVKPYIYISSYNEEVKLNEPSTDMYMFKRAVKQQRLIKDFLKVVASTSIECPFFNKDEINYKCFNCAKNNKFLYIDELFIDMNASNNCKEVIKVSAKEILVDGEKYYYSKSDEGIKLYKFNEYLNAYQEIQDDKIKKQIKE